jgi:hypothetical protein
MRLAKVVALLASLLAARAQASEFPFTGYVCVQRAEVAAGPGRRFYLTDHLPRGSQVEVYREDDAGWLAIRPPDGSFSWIPAEHVERLEGDVGKVKSATESWIGTSVEQVKEHAHHVSLKAGELVQVLAEKTVGTGEGQAMWLKIAPPAGEFRYVHSRDVSREPVLDEEGRQRTEDRAQETEDRGQGTEDSSVEEEIAEPERFRPSAGAIALRDIDEVRSRLAAMREDLAELAGPRTPGGREVQLTQFKSSESVQRSLSPDGFVPRKRRGSEQLEPVPVPSNRFVRGGTAIATPRLNPLPRIADARAGDRADYQITSRTVDSTSQQLDQWEVELSLMVAQDRATWNLAGLRQRVERLVETGRDPAERGRARLLLEKIKQFEETFEAGGQGPLREAATGHTEPAAGSPADPRYDARGWLKPVVSKTKPIAPYAVVDAEGKPLCFVTPSPGMNLGRYANKQIGVYGRRGYIESLQTPHVTAERVIDLERL